MHNLAHLSAREALARVRAGKLTCEKYVRACIEQVHVREPEVGAWQYVDAATAVAQARELDRKSARGVLHGIPGNPTEAFTAFDWCTAARAVHRS